MYFVLGFVRSSEGYFSSRSWCKGRSQTQLQFSTRAPLLCSFFNYGSGTWMSWSWIELYRDTLSCNFLSCPLSFFFWFELHTGLYSLILTWLILISDSVVICECVTEELCLEKQKYISLFHHADRKGHSKWFEDSWFI